MEEGLFIIELAATNDLQSLGLRLSWAFFLSVLVISREEVLQSQTQENFCVLYN
jgi:hypothetical protein